MSALEDAAEIAVGILRVELERVDGDFLKIDFERVNADWLKMLSPEELAAVETYIGDTGPITPKMIEGFERLGCFNLPEPDSIN
jgi:hypothetical protein